jgi:signal transduction histidine kinase
LFTGQLKEIREEKQNKLIRVEGFDKETVAIAKELQAYVEEERKLLEEAGKERQTVQTMVAGISHDFRTPLTAASGYMQIVAGDKELSDKNRAYIEKALNKTEYLRELSDEFFALSLVESRIEEYSQVSLKRLLEEVTLSQHKWIEDNGIEFMADICEDACEIRANEVDILRLLENLYSNTRKYVKSRIRISLKKEASKRVILEFENDSDVLKGVNAGDVFKPFHRAATGDIQGSGLGLYIAKRVVEKYGGTIAADIAGDSFVIHAEL